MTLLPQHREQLVASALDEEMIAERGYFSVEKKSELADLGFGQSQRRVPALVVPTFSVAGERRPPLARPDEPRIRKGREVKYEIPTDTKMFLDVPKRVQPLLGDPSVPLFITEGPKKADAGAAHGLAVVDLIGVWTWRGTNSRNGKAVLGELGQLEWLALKDARDAGRQVYVTFDSDVMLKPEVHQAMARLSGVLRERGAKLAYIYLPHRDGARKRGLDDAFADGFTVEDVLSHATPELRPEPADKVRVEEREPEFKPCSLEDAEKVFQEELFLSDTTALRLTLATIAANRRRDRPLWLLLVGPPSCGKTEIIWSVSPLAEVHPVSTLTPAALLSGTSEKERAKGATGGVLRKLGEYGVLLFKDFTSVLSMRHEQKMETLSALREVYDGSWTRPLGTDGGLQLNWEGHAGFIAGVTPTIDRHNSVMGAMGDRFVLVRMPELDRTAQSRRARGQRGRVAEMQKQLTEAACGAIAAIPPERVPQEPNEGEGLLLDRLADFTTRARSAVEREGGSHEILVLPDPEMPARFALALLVLLDGLDLIGATRREAWRTLYRVAFDSIPRLRVRVLERLYEVTEEVPTTEVLGELPPASARRALEDITVLGMVERVGGGQGKALTWALKDETREQMRFLKTSERDLFPKLPCRAHQDVANVASIREKREL